MTKICLLANNQEEAYRFARSQGMEKDQWFYAGDANDLLFKKNFHVIIVGIVNFHPSDFEKLYELALKRGRIDRL